MRDRIKEGNFINIQSWMVTKLKLKGNELLTYALIYGFSQNGSSSFKGSRSYIAEWCNTSLPTIDKAIKSLVDKKLIFKDSIIENKVTYNIYQANIEVVNNLYGGSKETLQGGSKETLYNNNILNNNINNISIVEQVIDYMNELAGTEFKSTTKKTQSLINARLKEGFTEEELKDVVFYKYNEWYRKPTKFKNGIMSDTYYRPNTLFSTNFEEYLESYKREYK